MKVSEEARKLIRELLEDTRALFDECMERLRLTDPEEYERYREEYERYHEEYARMGVNL